jgi:hypothetical protein
MRRMTKAQIAALSEPELADIVALVQRHGRIEELAWARRLVAKYRRMHPLAPRKVWWRRFIPMG